MTSGADWRPTARLETLFARARVMAAIRAFFAKRGVLEVETPLLDRYPVTDPNIHSLAVGSRGYLQTSPEFAMKRLLAAGSGPIYQICKSFRDDEQSAVHACEFTMVEWYRPGFDHHALMDEVQTLVQELEPSFDAVRLEYGPAFERAVGLDPHNSELPALRAACVAQAGLSARSGESLSRSDCLDLLFSVVVQPTLPRGISFVYHYPACQAALARLDSTARHAERFELFVDGVELANGYHELADASEQRRRMEADGASRTERGLERHPPDERLLAALEAGLGDVAGVALGFDRLLMVLTGNRDLTEIMAFGERKVAGEMRSET